MPRAAGRRGGQRVSGGAVVAALLSLAAVAAFALPKQLAAPSHRPSLDAPAVSAESVTRLRSRFVGTRRVQIWGRITAPDGSTVAVRIAAEGFPAATVEVPAVAGRFYASAPISRAMRGRRLLIRAGVTP